jgi:ribosome-associated protein
VPLRITDAIALDEREIEERFIQAGGPGGQNVNKVASAVELRFDLAHSPSLPDWLRVRAVALAGRRVSNAGVLVITARRFRTQERNRQDAEERLLELLREAARPVQRRVKTRVPYGEKKQRLEGKRRRSAVKRMRAERPE